MPRIVVLYPPPVDAAAFEKAYLEEHVPLVRAQMPAVTRLEMSRVKGGARGPYYWMVQLHFDSMDDLRSTSSSDGAQRASGHAQQISTGGAPTTLVVEDVHLTHATDLDG